MDLGLLSPWRHGARREVVLSAVLIDGPGLTVLRRVEDSRLTMFSCDKKDLKKTPFDSTLFEVLLGHFVTLFVTNTCGQLQLPPQQSPLTGVDDKNVSYHL